MLRTIIDGGDFGTLDAVQQEFNLRLSLQGLSQWGSLPAAIAAQGYSALLPVNSLADVHIMLYLDVLPSGSGKWMSVS